MLILPLMINNVIIKVTIKFKNVEIKKDRLDSKARNILESDVIIDKEHIKEYESKNKIFSSFKITDFIRKNANYSNSNLNYVEVNTKTYKDKEFYDTYIIPLPSYKPNKANDYIYGELVNNIRLSRPNKIKKTNLSLASLGFNELFNGEFYNKIRNAKNNNANSFYIREYLMNQGYNIQLEILDFLNNLDYTISNNTDVILTVELDTVNSFFDDTPKISNFLTNYKNMALSNYECYMNLALLNNLVNGKNLDWPKLSVEQQKILIHKMNSKGIVA